MTKIRRHPVRDVGAKGLGSPPPGAPVRIGVYARVSTESQVEAGYSIPMQLEAAETWAERRYGPGNYVLQIFKDEGLSGKLGWEPPARGPRRYRPALGELVQSLRAGLLDVLWVYRQDRLFRNHALAARFYDEYLPAGSPVEFESYTEPVNLNTSTGRFTTQVTSAAGELYLAQLRKICSDSRARRVREGLPCGQIPYGWLRTPGAPGIRPGIAPDPERLEWVRRAYELALQGFGPQRIAEELERLGAPSPQQSGTWDAMTVKRMLTRPIHSGRNQYKGEFYQGVHWEHRVVEPDEWEQVQQLLAERTGVHYAYVGREHHPLFRVGRCATCGEWISVVQVDGRPQYRCVGSKEKRHPRDIGQGETDPGSPLPWKRGWCTGWTKAVHPVDSLVLRLLTEVIALPEFQQLAEEEAHLLLLREGRQALERQREQFQKALQTSKETLREMFRLLVQKRVPQDIYDEEYARWERHERETSRELQTVERRLADTRGEEALLARIRLQLAEAPRLWEAMQPGERQMFLRQLTEYIVIDRSVGRWGAVRVKFPFLPELSLPLRRPKCSRPGYGKGVGELTPRELALLCLTAEGLSIPEIAERWHADRSGLYHMRNRLLRRLEVATLAEAVEVARERWEGERERLPLDVPAQKGQPYSAASAAERVEQVLAAGLQGLDRGETAEVLGIAAGWVHELEIAARKYYGVETFAQAVARYAVEGYAAERKQAERGSAKPKAHQRQGKASVGNLSQAATPKSATS